MVATEQAAEVTPWWVSARAPWTGKLFERMALEGEGPEVQRIQRLRRQMLAYPDGKEGTISLQRARLLTDVYKQTEGEPEVVRRALAFANVLENVSLPLWRHHLLAGSPASGLYAVEVEPEFQAGWLYDTVTVAGQQMSELDALVARPVHPYNLSPEDKEELLSDILPYWRPRSHKAVVLRELERNYPEALAYYRDSQTYAHIIGVGLGHTIQDYAAVLGKGLEQIKLELAAAADSLDGAVPQSMSSLERRNHYRAMLILADATITYSRRYAQVMEETASTETDAMRAAELKEMARICRKVPARPAESWWEALQSWTILHTVTYITEGGGSHSAGRFDQYMLPYLMGDLSAGRITRQQAQELLECFFLKFYERRKVRGLLATRAQSGVRANDKITIGGVDRHGHDRTNELSFMCLEASAHVHLSDPVLSVRLHRNTPDDFLQCSLELARLGGGIPLFMSDEVIVPALVSVAGVALADARNYADIGCQENSTDPNTAVGADCNGRNNAGYFNFTKFVELALFNGVNAMNGLQVGPQTGDPRDFATIQEFAQAVRRQLEYGVRMNVIFNNVFDYAFRRVCPAVYHSLMHPGPRRTGLDYTEGGCKYNWTGAIGMGLANAADSIAAVEHLIYETQSITWDDLLKALAADWEGYEGLRRACMAAPKYGADDEGADRWAKFILDSFFEAYERYPTAHGGRFVTGLFSMGHYVTRGELTAATPDGRKRGEMLADSGCAPSVYAPSKGPTAVNRSVTRAVDSFHTVNGVTFNQRLSLTNVSSPREIAKWADLLRTFVDMGGQSVQYTVADQEMLLAAQRHPERYPDLIVRVGGYSAHFVELTREMQDSIIARAEQQL